MGNCMATSGPEGRPPASKLNNNFAPNHNLNQKHLFYTDARFPVVGAAYTNSDLFEACDESCSLAHGVSNLSMSNNSHFEPELLVQYGRPPAGSRKRAARHLTSSRPDLAYASSAAAAGGKRLAANRSSYGSSRRLQDVEPQLSLGMSEPAARWQDVEPRAPLQRRHRRRRPTANHLASRQQQEQQAAMAPTPQPQPPRPLRLRQHDAYPAPAAPQTLLPKHLQHQHQQQQQQQHLQLKQRPKTSALAGRHRSQSSLSLYSSHSSFTSNTIPVGLAEPNFVPESLYHLQSQQRAHHKQQQQHQAGGSSNLSSSLGASQAGNNSQRMYLADGRTQKGLAYSDEERRNLNLRGLLPAAKQDLATQIKGVVNFVTRTCQDELSKYVYLRNLKDFNERLFYASLMANVELLMPIVYTPVVGLACQKFSHIYMRPRGMFITINDLNEIGTLLANWPERNVRVIVVTDGERILGLGDLGANGMGISIGKLSLYTALAGIPPENVLPVTIDVGTNNKELLQDELYIGLKHERIRGELYEKLLDEFMRAVAGRWGRSCLVQFEDFANSTAFGLLQRYRDKYCTFNDDIQGTASVCLSGLLSAGRLIGKRLSDCDYLFYGAGEANLGTANLLVMAMMEESSVGLAEARSRIWLVDSKGLVVASRPDISGHKRSYARANAPPLTKLIEIIELARPCAIVGASAQGGSFDESICKLMAKLNERPIIFALSNPTSKAECTAQQAYEWTGGRCVFASGSPFEPVQYQGKSYITGQGNNAYIFPAVGLAAIAAHVHTIPEDTFLVAAKALSDQLTSADSSLGLVYPRLNKIREVTLRIALRVLEHFYSERLATYRPEPDDKLNFLRSIQYDCNYAEPSAGLARIEAAAASVAATFEHVSVGNQTVARANNATNL